MSRIHLLFATTVLLLFKTWLGESSLISLGGWLGFEEDDKEPATTTSVSSAFTASVEYMILVPGAIEFNIAAWDYDFYFVAIMNDLAVKVADQVLNPSGTIQVEQQRLRPPYSPVFGNENEATSSNNNETAPTIETTRDEASSSLESIAYVEVPVPPLRVDLPTSIDQLQEFGFTDAPTMSEEDGIFLSGTPCPSRLGDPSKDRCEQVTASIRVVLAEPADVELIQALKLTYKAGLDEAILQGQLDALLLEKFPWTDILVLTGYHVSSVDMDVDSEQDIAPTNKVVGSTQPAVSEDGGPNALILFGGICLGILIFVLLALFGIFLFRRQRQKQTLEKDNTRNSQSSQNEPTSGSMDRDVIERGGDRSIEPTGLEWGRVQAPETQISVHDPRRKDRNKEWADAQSVNSHASSSVGHYSQGFSTVSSMSSLHSFRGSFGRRYPSAGDVRNGSVKEESGPSSNISHHSSRTDSALTKDDGSVSVSPSLMSYSSAGSMQPSVDSTVATANIMQGTPVVTSQALWTEASPLAVEDFDALEAAVLAGDWKALGSQALAMQKRQQQGQISVQSWSTGGVSSVYGEPSLRHSQLGGATTSRRMSSFDDDSGIYTTEYDAADEGSKSSQHPTAWQGVLDAVKGTSHELAEMLERGNWGSVADTAERLEVSSMTPSTTNANVANTTATTPTTKKTHRH